MADWQPVDANTPRHQKLVFWIVTKPDDEQWQDTSGRSINYGREPIARLHHGVYGSWPASMKATHWQHEYNYGEPGRAVTLAQRGDDDK